MLTGKDEDELDYASVAVTSTEQANKFKSQLNSVKLRGNAGSATAAEFQQDEDLTILESND